ncbi:MAG TPA: hypothetical protein DDY20_04465 [Desulfobulbaceae bacterium]|nr:hypothetical protein [Desulfobulbaceae bacterium]
MRLKRLDLKAFGPFTDRTLEFDSPGPALHIVFGPNEAGKSTSLRALKTLLYGFPERTSDNFLHANDQLLVGGCLQAMDGRELSFFRRKKRKADLLDLAGNPLDPALLATFLHGIEPALFASLYGIDHSTLVEGGEDILAQKGEVGQALFAAGAGISSLKKILNSLDAEADELFKPRGTKQQINAAISDFVSLKKTVREASLLPGTWKEHQKRLQEAEAEQARLEEESRRKGAEVQRLDRLRRAIPELAELHSLQKQLRELGDVALLPPEFSMQLRQVEQDIRASRLQLEKDRDRLHKLRASRDVISPNQALLDQAETIEDLHQRLGAYRKGQQDRNRLDGMRITHRKDAGSLVRTIRTDLTLEDIESLRPLLGRKRTIQGLSSRHEVLAREVQQAVRQKDEADKELGEIDRTLASLPAAKNSDGLAKALKLARLPGDIDGQIHEISREIEAGNKAALAELKRLGLWAGELAQLLNLTLPLPETVRRFDADFSELDRQRQQLRKDRAQAEMELQAARTDAREVAYGGEVPNELDLKASRQKRQQGWQLLRRQWIAGEDISKEAVEYSPGQPVHDAYERHVGLADHLADRLRREAERVTRSASLRARIENLEETVLEIDRQERKISERGESLATAWQAEWKSLAITPLSPREMLAWLTAFDTLRFKAAETSNRQAEVAEKLKIREGHRNALLAELKALAENAAFSGSELAPVLVFAESVAEDIARHKADLEKILDKQARVRNTLTSVRKELKEAEAATEEWRTMWNKALAGLGLKEQVLPAEAVDLLEILSSCFDKLEKAKDLQSRIDGIARDAETFRGDVQTLVALAAPDLQELPPEQAALQLHIRLGQARQDHELLQKNQEETAALTVERENEEKTLHSLEGRMAELLMTAGCSQAADLAEAISKSAAHQRLQELTSAAEISLAKVSEGVPLEEITRQASAVNVDDLPGQITALKRQIEEEIYPRIKDISKVIGEENRELQHMDGRGKAAAAAEKMAQVAARIRRLVDHYTRIKLAAKVLRDEIERYREEHQEPVLRIASRIFSELTLGSFTGLRTDVDDNNHPILVGVRPDDSRLTVASMSSGTRDQLFLALRLATLEWRLEGSEPLPFIVDDILVNFDDDRSRATLKALAGLGARNQVILFTHHRRIVDEAAQLSGMLAVYVHAL